MNQRVSVSASASVRGEEHERLQCAKSTVTCTVGVVSWCGGSVGILVLER
jgi:hypothetical protein